MTGEESVNDNAFDMDVNGSSRKLTPVVPEQQRSTTAPSPTGYRDYKPPAEVLSNNYGTTFHGNSGFDNARNNFKRDQEKEDDFAHKTILLGDSGVGKTSLLVQFDTGNFQPGNFAATVGIGFTELSLGRPLSVRKSQFVVKGARGGKGRGGEEEEEEEEEEEGDEEEEKYEEARSRWNGSRVRLELSDPWAVWQEGSMNTVEESVRTVTKRSKLGSHCGTSKPTDWSSSTTPTSGTWDPDQVVPTAGTSRFSSASLRTQDPLGPPSRRFDNLDSAARQATPDQVDFFFKVMLLGDSGVGKTCLLTRFRDGRFLFGNYITTVGIDFRNKIVTVDETKVKLQIWDTAGQERFRSVTHAYYRDAHGNKSDCGQERAVKKEDGERLAQEYKVPFMETSAKTGLNVELAFLAVARELKARKSNDPDDTKFNVEDYVRRQSKRNSCFNSNCLTT
ncbi:hypothetical protein M0802_001228 [Mischocyttarus mexicanus]|nr:hypothetical protein M0802_001228 [Mischocyttarus mexicanus]